MSSLRERPDFSLGISRAGIALKFVSQMSVEDVRLKRVTFATCDSVIFGYPRCLIENDRRRM